MNDQHNPAPTFAAALRFWLKLGFISFGGPAGQIAIMHEFLVERKRWLSEAKFMHALRYCMLLPGPEAQQLAIYTGWLLHGTRGGLAAGILFVLPSMGMLWVLSFLYVRFGQLPLVAALFDGLQPAVVALVLLALVKIARKSLHTRSHYAVAALAFVAIFWGNVPFPIVIAGALLLGFALGRYAPELWQSPQPATKLPAADAKTGYLLTQDRTGPGFSAKRLAGQVAVAALLWVLPLVAFALWSDDAAFWYNLSLFFTRAAVVTFGGAYAVLPYVAQVAVEQFHWLSAEEMLDGLALGETTPGPLIMVLAFVGFMAGWHASGGSLMAATIGLLTTTFYTFLPSFFFVLAGAPLMERSQTNEMLKNLLQSVTCAVVGVILSLTIYLFNVTVFQGNYWPDWIMLGWMAISAVALYRFKINIIGWILVSAGFGALTHIFSLR